MSRLAPLETLYEVNRGSELPLPPELATVYGRLAFPPHPGRPWVIGNFVTSLDGVTSLQVPGQAGGGPISGFNAHDRFVMGLLRAAADAVIVGAGTLRAVGHHIWIAPYIFPALAEVFQRFRIALGKPVPPLNVIITARGEVDPDLPVFQSGDVPVVIVTTPAGARRLRELGLPSSVQIGEGESSGRLSARSILAAEVRVRASDLILVEGGPHLLGDFFAEQCLDEQLLTLSPPGLRPERSAGASGAGSGKALRAGAFALGNTPRGQTRREPPVSPLCVCLLGVSADIGSYYRKEAGTDS